MQRQILHSGMLDKEEMVLKIEETKYKMINWLIKLKLWADRIESLASHRLGLNAILAAQIIVSVIVCAINSSNIPVWVITGLQISVSLFGIYSKTTSFRQQYDKIMFSSHVFIFVFSSLLLIANCVVIIIASNITATKVSDCNKNCNIIPGSILQSSSKCINVGCSSILFEEYSQVIAANEMTLYITIIQSAFQVVSLYGIGLLLKPNKSEESIPIITLG